MKQKEDLFTTYEVDERGYCVNFQGKSARTIQKEIEKSLKSELLECLDYFSPAMGRGGESLVYDPTCRRVIVYSVRGGSEGFYLHIDMTFNDGTIKNLLLAKTLDGKPDRIKALEDAVWRIVDAG